MHISVVIGNPNPGGRTTRVAETLAQHLATVLNVREKAVITTVELAHVAARLFVWEDAELARLNQNVAASDVVITACPTYKASYTGLLKAFLDRYQNNGLAGTVAIPVMVGAAPQHALAVETHMRPLLVELGASVPTRGLYVLESQMDQMDTMITTFLDTAGPLLARALRH